MRQNVALQRRPVVHRTADDALVDQPQQTVGHHLAAAVEALVETAGAAFALDQRPVFVGQIERVQQGAVVIVVLLATQGVMHQGVTQGADADLQRAAVTDQRAGVQADKMVLQIHRHIGRAEQPGVPLRVIQQDVHVGEPLSHPGVVFHERQIAVHLPHGDDGFTGVAAGLEHGQQFQRHFRVAGETVIVAVLAIGPRTARQQLRHHVHAARVQVTGGVGVVDADVMALRAVAAQHAARLKEKLEHPDVVGQLIFLGGLQVVQLFIVTEHPLREGLQKTLFQIAAGAGPAQ